LHEFNENISERLSFTFSPFLCDAMDIDGTLTDLKSIWVNDFIKGVNETTSRGESSRGQ
jgi:hypothetical protein